MNNSYLCTNIANCKDAQNENLVELTSSDEKICKECGKELELFVKKKKINLLLPLSFSGIILLLTVIFFTFFFKKEDNTSELLQSLEIEIPSIPIESPETKSNELNEPKTDLLDEKSNEIVLNKNQVQYELNEISNKNIESKIRLAKIEDFLKWFSNDAEIRILGKESGATLELTQVKEYLERVAYFKTIENIEIVEIFTNNENLIWEIRIIENHK